MIDYQRLFGELAGCSRDLVLIIDAGKDILFVNRHAAGATGYRKRELLGRNLSMLFGVKNRRNYVARIFADLKKSGRWSGELELVRKNGVTFWADTRARSLRAAKRAGSRTLVIVRDLSDERMASQAAWGAESRIRRVLDAMEDALYVCDASGTILTCNEACCTMTGYRRDEIVGMTMPYPWLEVADRRKLQKGLRLLSKEGVLKNYVVGWRRRDGASIVASLALSKLAPGRKPLAVVSVRDITDVEYAGDLRRTNEQIGRLLEDVKRKAEQLRILRTSNLLVLNEAGIDRVFKTITGGVRKIVGHDLAGIYVFNAADQCFRPHTVSKQTAFSRQLARFPLKLGEGIVGTAALSGKLVLVNDAHLDPRSRYPEGMRPGKEHLIAVPLKRRGSIFGVLVVARNRDPGFLEEEALIVQSFADAVLVALENARLHEELQKLRTATDSSRGGPAPPG